MPLATRGLGSREWTAGYPWLSIGGTHWWQGSSSTSWGWLALLLCRCLFSGSPEYHSIAPQQHLPPTDRGHCLWCSTPGSPRLVLVPWHSSSLRWTAGFLLNTYSAQTVRTVSDPLRQSLCKFCYLSSQCTIRRTMCLGLFQVLQLSEAEMFRQTFPLVFSCAH